MNSTTRVLLTLAAVVVIAFGLKAAESVVVSFLLSAFIAIIAAPPIFWLEQRRVPDAIAITGVMIAMVGILVTVGALLVQFPLGGFRPFSHVLGDLTQPSVMEMFHSSSHVLQTASDGIM